MPSQHEVISLDLQSFYSLYEKDQTSDKTQPYTPAALEKKFFEQTMFANYEEIRKILINLGYPPYEGPGGKGLFITQNPWRCHVDLQWEARRQLTAYFEALDKEYFYLPSSVAEKLYPVAKQKTLLTGNNNLLYDPVTFKQALHALGLDCYYRFVTGRMGFKAGYNLKLTVPKETFDSLLNTITDNKTVPFDPHLQPFTFSENTVDILLDLINKNFPSPILKIRTAFLLDHLQLSAFINIPQGTKISDCIDFIKTNQDIFATVYLKWPMTSSTFEQLFYQRIEAFFGSDIKNQLQNSSTSQSYSAINNVEPKALEQPNASKHKRCFDSFPPKQPSQTMLDRQPNANNQQQFLYSPKNQDQSMLESQFSFLNFNP